MPDVSISRRGESPESDPIVLARGYRNCIQKLLGETSLPKPHALLSPGDTAELRALVQEIFTAVNDRIVRAGDYNLQVRYPVVLDPVCFPDGRVICLLELRDGTGLSLVPSMWGMSRIGGSQAGLLFFGEWDDPDGSCYDLLYTLQGFSQTVFRFDRFGWEGVRSGEGKGNELIDRVLRTVAAHCERPVVDPDCEWVKSIRRITTAASPGTESFHVVTDDGRFIVKLVHHARTLRIQASCAPAGPAPRSRRIGNLLNDLSALGEREEIIPRTRTSVAGQKPGTVSLYEGPRIEGAAAPPDRVRSEYGKSVPKRIVARDELGARLLPTGEGLKRELESRLARERPLIKQVPEEYPLSRRALEVADIQCEDYRDSRLAAVAELTREVKRRASALRRLGLSSAEFSCMLPLDPMPGDALFHLAPRDGKSLLWMDGRLLRYDLGRVWLHIRGGDGLEPTLVRCFYDRAAFWEELYLLGMQRRCDSRQTAAEKSARAASMFLGSSVFGSYLLREALAAVETSERGAQVSRAGLVQRITAFSVFQRGRGADLTISYMARKDREKQRTAHVHVTLNGCIPMFR